MQPLSTVPKRSLYAVWAVLIGAFAVLHALNLSADFPNHTPWLNDWAKYTDEGWYANAAVRAHLFGNWYIPGDFNPAPAVPVWPFLEWILFFFTGVTIEAARGLAIASFFASLLLSYWLLRVRGSRWMALLTVTLMVTSPFVYCFSRLAILEPMLVTLTLAALNISVRLPQMRRPIAASVCVGILSTLMMLTKTTAIFLLPALGWALFVSCRGSRKLALRCAAAASAAFAATFGVWMSLVVSFGFYADYKYLFFINKYKKPAEFYWPLLSLWWSLHGGIWIDHILFPLAAFILVVTLLGATLMASRNPWSRRLLHDPVFGSSIIAALGYIFFMTYQNHPQPRYYAVVAIFCFFIVALGAEALVSQPGIARFAGSSVVALAVLAALINSVWTINYAAHPEYTFVTAAHQLADYIDHHPNGNRLLVSISGDELSLVNHLPVLCDDFGTPTKAYPDLSTKLAHYHPGWWATWNDIDPGTLEDLHTQYSLEQVASFRAFDDPDRNILVLFKLHPLPNGEVRQPVGISLQAPFPDDKIHIPVE